MKKSAIIILLSALALSLFSCHSKNDEPAPTVPPLPSEKDIPDGGTVLVYMVAANNLGRDGWDEQDIDEMRAGMKALSTANPARLLVYHADAGTAPVLKEIGRDGEVAEVKSYPTDVPSVAVARMREVVADASADASVPLRGIIFWSHGSGWIEETGTYDDPDLPSAGTYSFGIDTGGKRMSVPALGKALAGCDLRFIYFDCCLMGTVEVAYELRHCAEKIAAVATELPLEGMPYDRNMRHFFSGKTDALERAARTTYDYYCSPEATNNSIAIGVCRTSQLDDLAGASRRVMESGAIVGGAYAGIPFYRPSVTATGSFDMGHYYSALGAPDEWKTAYAKAVSYHAATPTSYDLDMTGFSGMGCNIFSSATDPRLKYGYRRLQWWADVVSHHPIFTNP